MGHRRSRQYQRNVPRGAAARPDRDTRGMRGAAGQPGRWSGPALCAPGGRGPGPAGLPARPPAAASPAPSAPPERSVPPDYAPRHGAGASPQNFQPPRDFQAPPPAAAPRPAAAQPAVAQPAAAQPAAAAQAEMLPSVD